MLRLLHQGGYLSGTIVTKRLKRFLGSGIGKRPTIIPLTLLPTGVYRASVSRRCWCALTAPLHPYHFPIENGGIFLWHYPHDHSHWALPSKFGLSEARTFLKLAALPNLQPPAPTLSPYLV